MQAVILALPPYQKISEQASLGTAIAVPLGGVGLQAANVVGELALQEAGGFIAAESDDAELRQIRDNGAASGGDAFGRRVAIMQDCAVFD